MVDYYTLTEETKTVLGSDHTEHILFRIRYTDGLLGGFIEGTKNLTGGLVYDEACVFEDAVIGDGCVVAQQAMVYGSALLSDRAMVYGSASVFDHAKICELAEIYGDAKICGNACIGGDRHVFSGCIS